MQLRCGAHVQRLLGYPPRIDADHRSSPRVQTAKSDAAATDHVTFITTAPRRSSTSMVCLSADGTAVVATDTGTNCCDTVTAPASQATLRQPCTMLALMRHCDLGYGRARHGALGQDLRLQLRAVAPALTTLLRIHSVQLLVNWTGSLLLHSPSSRLVRRTLTVQQCHGHLRVDEHGGPFGELQVGRDHDADVLAPLAQQVE